MKIRTLTFLFTCLVSLQAMASATTRNFWYFLPEGPDVSGKVYIRATEKHLYQINTQSLRNYLQNAPKESTVEAPLSSFTIDLPYPDGSFHTFRVVEAPVMASELQAQYPEIRTYLGQGITDPTANIRFDLTPQGFHAMVFALEGTYFIDPYIHGNANVCIVYFKKHFQKEPEELARESGVLPGIYDIDSLVQVSKANGLLTPNGSIRRNYRLAVTTSKEYTLFHGNTVASALAAVVTSVNRITGVFEREFAIRLTLVANNNLLIFTAANDPWSNQNSTQVTINEAPIVINATIGLSAYDIGHVFNTGAGGLAQLQSVCTSNKARGVSGLTSPVSDPFDVAYVCHEIGHQFGATHTFNSSDPDCLAQRSSGTAVEPGSGTTIMAYAGLCPGQNVSFNTDDYFNTVSYEQVVAFSSNFTPCVQSIGNGNSIPTVSLPAGSGTFTIPRGTPFSLTGSGSDANGDALTYNWEQVDIGPATAPNAPTGNSPVFRSVRPDTTPTRFFPPLSVLRSGTSVVPEVGEALTNYARNLSFILTVRDNRAGGGGVNNTTPFVLTVSGQGPIEITSPSVTSAAGNFLGWSNAATQLRQITWNVNGTNTAPLNIANVRIEFSTDNGLTWPIVLKASTPNDGLDSIVVPNVSTLTGRLRIVSTTPNLWYAWARATIRINAVTGIDRAVESKPVLDVYPNPASHSLQVQINPEEWSNTPAYQLTDVQGRVVQQGNLPITNDEGLHTLSLQAMQGLYYLRLFDRDRFAITKIVVQP
jgi:hypothetical protein